MNKTEESDKRWEEEVITKKEEKGFACPKTQSQLFSDERTSPLPAK